MKTLPLIGKVSKKGIFLESIKVNAITDHIEILRKIKDAAQKFSPDNNIVNTGNPGMDTLLSKGQAYVHRGQASVQAQGKYLRILKK